ncbi:MAG TPA: CotH kinase family protein, partial [Candidatus Eisenbacteria bacterium]
MPWPYPAETGVAIFALAVVALCCATYQPWVARYASRWASGSKALSLVEGVFDPFRDSHVLLASGLPVYTLKIRPRQYAILQQAAEQANKNGWLNDDLKTWADATFLYDGCSYDVKVRIRGDLRAHWSGPKKSYRIKFGKQTITDAHGTRQEPIYFQGKHEINLIIPSDRLYALAPWMSSLMRDAGVVTPRDRFVLLKIDGVLHGLYYEVEQFDHPLLAAARRPETTIFGQNNRAMHYEHFTRLGRPGSTDAGLDPGSLRRQVDPDGDLGLRAMQVLIDYSRSPTPDGFRRVRAVLDWDKYLRYRAVSAICNTNHDRFGTDNLKFFYDPSRGLLEPVQWDVKLIKMPREPGTIDFYSGRGTDEIQRATLLDPELRLQRNQFIWRMVDDGGDRLMARFDAIHDRLLPLAWADVLVPPTQAHKMQEIRSTLEFNVRRAHKVLEYSSANVTFRLLANERASLDIACLNYSGIRLHGIELADSLLSGRYRLFEETDSDGELGPRDSLVAEAVATDGKVRLDLDRYVFPDVQYGSNRVHGAYWEFFDARMGRKRFFVTGRLAAADRGPLDFRPPRVAVAADNAVTGRTIPSATLDPHQSVPTNSIGVLAYDASDPWDLEAESVSLAEFLGRHRDFRASPTHPGAAELAGRTVLVGTCIVPRSVPLLIRPGADITLKPGASVVCFGGCSAIGTAQAPIRIHGDGSGKPWDTFAVVRPPEKVVIAYTHIRDGGQAQVNGILFTGGLAVHDGDLELRHCSLTD